MSVFPPLLNCLIVSTGLFLIVLIMQQRGKSSGLIGGLGDANPFALRVADQWTWLTVFGSVFFLFVTTLQVRVVQYLAMRTVGEI